MKSDPQKLISRFNKLRVNRANWESLWNELAHYIMPEAEVFTAPFTEGEKLGARLTNNMAQRAALILAAGLHGNLTSPAAPWFSLKMETYRLNKIVRVQRWLDEMEQRMYAAFNQTNFNQEIHSTYLQLACFGTSILFADKSRWPIRFYTRPLSECYIAEDLNGVADTVFRFFKMNSRQMVERFGVDAVNEKIRDSWESKPDESFEIIHAVYPRYDRDPSSQHALEKKWASCYVEKGEAHLLRESGFDDFPYIVPRWLKTSFEVYGRSAAMNALADIKMLNAMKTTLIRAAQKGVDPPMQVPWNGFMGPINANPGGVTVSRLDLATQGVKEMPTKLDGIPIGMEMVKNTVEEIKEAFFVDLFLLLQDRPQMTATEVMERVEEKMVVLGPALGRLQTELLEPVIEMTFNTLLESGRDLPPPPPEVSGENWSVDYVSPLARAQRFQRVVATQRALQYIAQIAQFDQSVAQKPNGDRLVEEIWEAMGLSPESLRDDEEMAQIRAAIQERMRMAQALQVGEKSSSAAARLLKAVPDNRKDEMMAQMGAA